MIGLELLDLVDENGVPTGEVKERELVHRDGDRHRTSHVWLFRQRNGRWQVLLQKRSEQKDSHPGCYDISSAGHIPAGVDWVSSALRELEEELGLHMQAEQLHLAGVRRFDWRAPFTAGPSGTGRSAGCIMASGRGSPRTCTSRKARSLRWSGWILLPAVRR